MKYFYSLLLFLAACHAGSAQQYPLFTNFMINRYGYNPAINMDTAGATANLVFRKQWAGLNGAPSTQIGGIRGRIKPLPIGTGAYFFKDVAGVIRRTGAYGMFNFIQQLTLATRISVGASLGFYSFKLNNDFKVSDDVDQLVPNALDGRQFADFNAGVYLQHKDAYFGFSIPQIAEKALEFSDLPEKSVLLRHYYALAGYKYKVKDKLWVEPSVMFKFVGGAPAQIDGGLKICLDKLWLGGTWRSGDAMTAMIGVDLGAFEAGYAYDITTSSLRTISSGTHEFSIECRFGKPKDSDNDGCPDKDDKCPDKPGPKENGCCPEEKDSAVAANEDSDNDGCPDKDDKCPDTPGPKSNQGCPWGDRDGDGIRDDIDKCPDLPGTPSNQGCPIDDRDQDGIVDRFDRCPDEPGSLRSEGCPNDDTDGDGVTDADDRCPNTKGLADNGGCPSPNDAEKEILSLAILHLYYDTDKSEIWKESYPFLNKLSELLLRQPDWKLHIAGHADARASNEYNIALSKRRSESVMFFLMDRGVKREQLIVEYYGEEAPAANNASEGGMQLNRRVEMEFVFK